MRLFCLFFCVTVCSFCFGQSMRKIYLPAKKDTLIPFRGPHILNLYGFETRVIPFDSKIPLYVSISYEHSKRLNYEYFRIDSSSYLEYEYFRNAKINDNEGLKSRGAKVIKNKIIGNDTVTGIGVGYNTIRYLPHVHYYKEFSKEGPWEEYEDSTSSCVFWKGAYKDNKRTGLWKRLIYASSGDELTIEEINYDKDSTTRIYSNNIIHTIEIEPLKKILSGRWILQDCENDSTKRILHYKCRKFNGAYRDEDACDNNYYQFFLSNEFIRKRGEGCYKYHETSTRGTWQLTEANGDRIIEIKFTNGERWKYKILYLDKDLQFLTERI